jgi:hypothetical protein
LDEQESKLDEQALSQRSNLDCIESLIGGLKSTPLLDFQMIPEM